MACEQSKSLLHAYLDGELDAAGMAGYEKHLEDLPGLCRNPCFGTGTPPLFAAVRTLRARPGIPSQESSFASSPAPSRASAHPGAWRWLAVAAALIIAVTLGDETLLASH